MGFSKNSSSSQSQSQQTSNSSNRAYDFLNSSLGGQVGYAGRSNNAIADLLGLNGAGAQTQGFDTFTNSPAYKFQQDRGVGAITSSNAAKGMLNSGDTLKRITEFGQGLASTYLDKYLAQLSSLGGAGLNAGQIIGSAGGISSSSGTSSGTSTGKSSSFQFG